LKIKFVTVNNRKKAIEIETSKDKFSLPFSRLELRPSAKNKIAQIFVDKELGSRAVTYLMTSGKEASVHLDAFLDYNKDPDFVRAAALYQRTIAAMELMSKSSLSKHEVVRRLKTSPSQLARLLDPANKSKSVDEMLRLMSVLGYRVEWQIVKEVA